MAFNYIKRSPNGLFKTESSYVTIGDTPIIIYSDIYNKGLSSTDISPNLVKLITCCGFNIEEEKDAKGLVFIYRASIFKGEKVLTGYSLLFNCNINTPNYAIVYEYPPESSFTGYINVCILDKYISELYNSRYHFNELAKYQFAYFDLIKFISVIDINSDLTEILEKNLKTFGYKRQSEDPPVCIKYGIHENCLKFNFKRPYDYGNTPNISFSLIVTNVDNPSGTYCNYGNNCYHINCYRHSVKFIFDRCTKVISDANNIISKHLRPLLIAQRLMLMYDLTNDLGRIKELYCIAACYLPQNSLKYIS